MIERRGPIRHDHIAGLKPMVEFANQIQFVRNDAVNDQVNDGTRGPAEQSDKLSHRKSTTRTLSARLRIGLLQFWRVGHAGAGAIHHPHPPPQPAVVGPDQRADSGVHCQQYSVEHLLV